MKIISRSSFLRTTFWLLAVAPMLAGAANNAGIQPAQPLSTPAPKYPYLQRRAEAAAEVTVAFTVNSRGEVTRARIEKSSNVDFNEASLAAIKRWTFAPARKDGQPVEMRLRQTFLFSVHDAPQADSKALLAEKKGAR
jgi:TonB family protein